MITRETVRDQLLAYLNQQITLSQLVDWAENVINEGDLEPNEAPLLADIIARLGAADVKDFELSWEDCHSFLSRLGYRIQVVAA